jgi:hypothetical protein
MHMCFCLVHDQPPLAFRDYIWHLHNKGFLTGMDHQSWRDEVTLLNNDSLLDAPSTILSTCLLHAPLNSETHLSPLQVAAIALGSL